MGAMSAGGRARRTIVVAALAGLAAGCATQTWTRDLFAKRLAEVDERLARVDGATHRHGERIVRADARITDVEARLDRIDAQLVQVDTDARAQRERLDRVEVRMTHLDDRVTETRSQMRGFIAQAPSTGIRSGDGPRTARSTPEAASRRTLIGVFHVPFGFDRADLDTRAQAALAAIVKELRGNPALTIELEGATDPVGAHEYNVRLSQRRAEAVQRWLETNGVSRARIVRAVGRGPLEDATVTDDAKRRVMVKLMTAE